MTIRLARRDDLPVLCDIEVAAGRIFRTVDMDAVAGDDPVSVDELSVYQQDGRAWVHTDGSDRPVGYLLVSLVDGHAHIAQVSVHPDHARQGLGAELIEEAVRWARARGLTTVSLTTFTEVAWNGPYYARLGFTVLPEDQLTEGLAAIRADEAERGLDRWPRTTMVRRI